LFTSDVLAASIWDCVKPLPPAVPAQVVTTSPSTMSGGSFWDVVTPTPPPITTDEEIVLTISTEIAEKVGEGIDIRVECDGGVVTITGTVSDDVQLQKINSIAQASAGVKSVANNATIREVEKKEEDKADSGQNKPPTIRYAPRRILRFRSGGCANGACNR